MCLVKAGGWDPTIPASSSTAGNQDGFVSMLMASCLTPVLALVLGTDDFMEERG